MRRIGKTINLYAKSTVRLQPLYALLFSTTQYGIISSFPLSKLQKKVDKQFRMGERNEEKNKAREREERISDRFRVVIIRFSISVLG